MNQVITTDFFDQDPQQLAIALLGKVMRRKVTWQGKPYWLAARIVETEAYYQNEKASHSSLGYTEKRKALFMTPGTIYMYYARGSDSLNFSAHGEGNGVLIKSAHPHFDVISPEEQLDVMRSLNPGARGSRELNKLCSGQTLLCRSLDLKVPDWNQRTLQKSHFYLSDVGYKVNRYIQCPRLGIPIGRDEHLLFRFVDHAFSHQATNNPLTKRKWVEGKELRKRGRETGSG